MKALIKLTLISGLLLFGIIACAPGKGGSGGGSQSSQNEVLIKISGDKRNQALVFYKVGDGQWKKAETQVKSASQDERVVRIGNVTGKYGVIIVCPDNQTIEGTGYFSTVNELNEINTGCSSGSDIYKVSGNITWSDPNKMEKAKIIINNEDTDANESSGNTYSVNWVTPGSHTLWAFNYYTDQNNNKIYLKVHKADVNVTQNTTHNIDFTKSPDADNTAGTFTCNDQELSVIVLLFMYNTNSLFIIDNTFISPATFKKVIPDSLKGDGYWTVIFMFAQQTGDYNSYLTLPLLQFSDRTCPGKPNYFGNITTSDANGRLKLEWDKWNPGIQNHSTRIYYFTGISSNTFDWGFTITPGWLGDCNPKCSFQFPDLSGVSGWNNNWTPSKSQLYNPNYVSISAVGSNKSLQELIKCSKTMYANCLDAEISGTSK